MKKNTVITIIQNLFMVLLFSVMLVLCVIYVRYAQSSDNGGLPQFPESEASLLSSGFSDNNSVRKSFILPCFVGGISGNGRYGGFYDDNSAYEVYGMFINVLKNAPRGTSKKLLFSDSAEKYVYLENLYAKAENCYYVRFENGVGFSVLCQLLSDTYTELPENPDFTIRDMFLSSGASGESVITAVDISGNVLRIYPSKNIPFNSEYLETYTDTEKNSFDFTKINFNTNADKNCYFPVFRYTTAYRSIIRKPFGECFDINSAGNDIRDFISAFGMNDDNTKFYRRTHDGAMICVEDVTSFEITPEGTFVFRPEEGGANLSALLDYSDNRGYGFYDYSCVSKNIVSALNKKLSGYCAQLSLKDITYNGKMCSFYYSYTVNGIPVHSEGEYALKLDFSEDRFVSAEGTVEAMEFLNEERTYMPQRTALALMDEHTSGITHFGAEYCFGTDSTNPDKGIVRWAVKTERREGGTQE